MYVCMHVCALILCIDYVFLNRVLVWGAGKFGQLGNGVRRDVPEPQNISQSLNLKSEIVQVSLHG